jgi:cAMP-dependent protein kinase regulator
VQRSTDGSSASHKEPRGTERSNRDVPRHGSVSRANSPDRSPLFSDLARDKLVEVIRGLNLLSFHPGDILITKGEPGENLLVISSGSVKAFVKNKEGRNVRVREMKEGEFFGEISLLSRSPRTDTITASTSCDLLELERETLWDIEKRYPNVKVVVQEFSERRSESTSKVEARSS